MRFFSFRKAQSKVGKHVRVSKGYKSADGPHPLAPGRTGTVTGVHHDSPGVGRNDYQVVITWDDAAEPKESYFMESEYRAILTELA
jgi:hypothetical protein